MVGNNQSYFCAHLWEKGQRTVNQDSLAFWWMKKGEKDRFLGIVCDGIGGLNEGENASTYVVKQMVAWFVSGGYKKNNYSGMKHELQQLFYQLHEDLKSYGNRERPLGTTVTFFISDKSRFIWGHCGDSRLYHIHKGNIHQLTTDHRLSTGALYRAIGIGSWQLLQLGQARLSPKDKLLICTDGFYRRISRAEMRGFAQKKIATDEMAERMLRQIFHKKEEMNEKDNISALYFGRTERGRI